MRRRFLLLFCATGLFVSLVARPVLADAIHFNTDTGVMSINGNAASDFFGVSMQTSVVGGIQQFRFLGDLTFIGSDVVTATGSRPLSLWSGDDVSIASGAMFNFDSAGHIAILGGGNGGSARSGAGAGSGGAGGTFAAGGAGGAGGVVSGDPSYNGANGGTGSPMNAGTPGGVGTAGQAGAAGQAGFNNISIQPGGSAGTAGTLGSVLTSLEDGGDGGDGGLAYLTGFSTGDDGEDGGNGFQNGFAGRNGGDGGNGGNGGGGQNNVTGFTLSGGSGGASGGSGGGGGGGGGGTSGQGGGGGGGGGYGQVIFAIENGGDGGLGGLGGQGGFGGNGSTGAGSGRGGAGGGAIEIAAQGRIDFAGTINIRGAGALNGFTSSNPQSGTAGGAGFGGFLGETTATGTGGDGGDGGDGTDGGSGGNGGRGGNGGHGGGGAGGTVMFKSSLFSADGGTINAGGGVSSGSAGGNGRYLVSDNGAALPNYGTSNGVNQDFQIGLAARDNNPLIQGSPSTPNMTQIVGGAEVYGLINVNFSGVPEYLELQENAPFGATAALVRRSIGYLGDQYIGHDMLMLVNLTTSALASPVLGICPTGEGYQSSLPERGFARNAAFGGSGPVTLTSLPAESVYATLVPNDLTDYEVFGYAGYGKTVSWDTLDVAYLAAPIFSLGDFDLDGDVDGRDFLMWQRGQSPIQWGPGDLADWQANYGFSSITAASTSVPEPGCALLGGGIAMMLFGFRRGYVG